MNLAVLTNLYGGQMALDIIKTKQNYKFQSKNGHRSYRSVIE